MALGDALNQAAWAFMSDWMQKRNAQYSLENMLKQQEGWAKHQERGSELETQRMLDQLQAQKEAAFYAKLLGIGDTDDPSAMRMIEILKQLTPHDTAMPAGVEGLVPRMQGRSDILSEAIPKLLTGQFEGHDYTPITQAAGGMGHLIRMLEQGGGRSNLMAQLPTQRANAAANLLGATGKGQTTNVKVEDRIFQVIGQTKADVDTIHRKFLPAGSGSANYDQILSAVMSIMPQEARAMDQDQAKEDARQWINKVGLEFFDDLAGLVNEIYIRAAQGQITEQEMRVIADAASPYKMATSFASTKEKVIADLEKDPKYKSFNIRSLMTTDPQLKRLILDETWKALYGGQ